MESWNDVFYGWPLRQACSKVNCGPREYLDQQLNDVFANCVAIRKFLKMVLISFEHL